MLIKVDNLRALQLLKRRGQPDQRHQDKQQRIGRHAQQNHVYQRIHALNTQKRLRAQTIQPKQTKFDNIFRQIYTTVKLGKNRV